MEVSKQILRIATIVISAIFIVACLAGVVISWSINTPITNAVTGVLGGAEHVLTAADKSIERVNNGLSEAQVNIDAIEGKVESVGETLSETSIVYEVLDRTVGDELFPKIAAASDTIMTIRDSLISFNDMLVAVNEIPFVSVPTLTEELDTAAESMSAVQRDAQEFRSELHAIKADAISKPVTAITDRTTRISDGLEVTLQNLSNSQANINEELEMITSIKARVPAIIDLTSAVLSFLFLWLAFGQVGLIVLSWERLREPQKSDTPDDFVSADGE